METTANIGSLAHLSNVPSCAIMGKKVSSWVIASWMVRTIWLAYKAKGLVTPEGVTADSA